MSKHDFFESHLEQAAMEWFEELNYETMNASFIAPDGDYPERMDYSDVLLEVRLREALKNLNPHLPADALEEAFRAVSIPQSPSMLMNNKTFHKQVTDGIDVSYRLPDGTIKNDKARLFDFEDTDNNDWLALNQLTVIEGKAEKRPDIVVFVNGMPLAAMELKNLADEGVDITDAYNQLQTYKETIPSLFVYNEAMVISDGINARIGSLTADEDRFMFWRTIDGDELAPMAMPQLEVLIKGVFDKTRLLDIVRHFILFQTDGGNLYKILAGYHQYHAVNKAVDSTVRATMDSGDRKIGVVWHTQGSGKSLTMVFYGGKLVLSPELFNPTIVVITDRNDLDDQLFGTFSKSSELLRQTPVQAENRSNLRSLLNRESGGVIFTTIQKFTPDEETGDTMPVLTDRSNVVVIADEAHRSQYGFEAKLEKGEVKYGYAKHLRDALPNASYIGFTGTPVELTDKNTPAVFGDYIDIYDMTRAVEDETTVRIFYESRIASLMLPDELKPQIDEEYEEITEYQEITQKEQLKSKWSRLEAIVGAEERVRMIAKDIIEHFEKRQASQETPVGKGMIVAMSRRIAVDLYNAITDIRPDWHNDDPDKGQIKVVMTGSSADKKEWQKHIGTKGSRERIAKRMKDNKDELKLVIVRDMWLTGFDCPSIHTMYVDKPMQGHNLMQAIARVNRVFGDKKGGLVVDYIGIAEHLKKALSDYTDSDKKNTGINTEDAVYILMEKLDIIRELLHGCDFNSFFTGKASERVKVIAATMDFVLGLREDFKSEYMTQVSALSAAFSLCATTDMAQNVAVEVGFHKAVKAALVKLIVESGKKKTVAQLDAELNQLVSKAISSDEVIDVLAAVGLNKPNIAILSDEFLEEVRGMEKKNLAVELLNRLLKDNLRAFSRRNLTQSKKFSELLDQSIKKYQNRTIETTQVIMELIELAKQMKDAQMRGDETGLSEDELAFYDAISENESAKEFMEDAILRQIAKDLTKAIRTSMTVDWAIRSAVQAKIKMVIRRLLKKYKYPPDKSEKAVEIVLEQARLMCMSAANA
jgi:type I restriction enzyme R subunit